jgi:hypothetical protein
MLQPHPRVLWVLQPVIHPRGHDRGWPRFTLAQWTHSSDQSHRLYLRVQGGVDSHDARGPEWEVVQYRRLLPERPVDAAREPRPPKGALVRPV